MPQKILPKVTYQPRYDGGEPDKKPPQRRTFGEDVGNAYQGMVDFTNNAIAGQNKAGSNFINSLAPIGDYFFGQGGKVAYPEGWEQKIGRPVPGARPAGNAAPMGPVTYNPFGDALQGIQDWFAGLGQGAQPPVTGNSTPPGWSPFGVGEGGGNRTPPGWSPSAGAGGAMQDATGQTPAGWVPTVGAGAPADMQTQAARLQDAVNKNQNLTGQAKAAGDDKEMARLDAEWARLISTPLYQQMYGGSDELGVKNRLINSYMQPGNDAAEPSFERAHARMVTDDWWAEEMTKAGAWTGDKFADQKLWDEHWHAMNKGGRDPLEGHPAAIQALEARKEEVKRMNQQAAYDALQQWMTKAKV